MWPNQEFALAEIPKRIAAGERKILTTSPTGSGKSLIICELIRRSLARGWQSIVYTNRIMLIRQLSLSLEAHGIQFGVRASGYRDERELPVQISSLPTERQRVINTEQWNIHGKGERKLLAIVDEAHLNGSDTAQKILHRHHDDGGVYVGVTATPIGLGHLYTNLLVAGTPSQMRQCGAIVRAHHYGPDEPDMKNFKQVQKTGEYSEGDVRKAIMTKCIFARVLEHYRKLNPDQRPTILFAPGVGESIWFTEQFVAAGIPWAHIDGANVWLDGELRSTSETLREEIIERLKSGDIKGVSNRFVLREGIDIPEVSHGIFATVMGGLQTFIQSAGRLLRSCGGKEHATIQDHGGHWWRHGSVNADREWTLGLTENIIAGLRAEKLREKKEREPIQCPDCGMVRKAGPKCDGCGHESSLKSRKVIQQDGTLREMVGDIYKPRRISQKPNAADIWRQCYHRARNSKNKMTFRQAEALYAMENHWGYPPRDLPLMPKNEFDWFLPVADVPRERLT